MQNCIALCNKVHEGGCTYPLCPPWIRYCTASNIFLNCCQDPYLTLEEAGGNVVVSPTSSEKLHHPLTKKQLLDCAELIRSKNATPVADVMDLLVAEVELSSDPFHLAIVHQLMAFFL